MDYTVSAMLQEAGTSRQRLPATLRVAVLFYRIGPYHYARLKAAGAALDVAAVEYSNVDPIYAWDEVGGQERFERRVLFSGTSIESQNAVRIRETLETTLDQLRPAAVAIPGWSDRCSLAALNWCGRRNVPAVVMSESTAWDDERRWWKEALKRRLVGLYSTGLVGGRAHAEYAEQLGMPRDRIFLGYDTVDNDYFMRGAAEVSTQKKEARKKLALPENFFLASARFVEKKNLSRLVQAYSQYRAAAPKSSMWDLVLLGDGPLRAQLCNLVSELGLQHCVMLPGFKQYGELPAHYGLANAFIHASTTEQWGLVVNEAMASGLPVLVSKRCGCAADLVQEGVNGFSFDPCDIEQLARLMLRVSGCDFRLSAFGLESRRIITRWGTGQFAAGLKHAVDGALAAGPKNISTFDRLILRCLGWRRLSCE